MKSAGAVAVAGGSGGGKTSCIVSCRIGNKSRSFFIYIYLTEHIPKVFDNTYLNKFFTVCCHEKGSTIYAMSKSPFKTRSVCSRIATASRRGNESHHTSVAHHEGQV